jgi:hypothetical protein
MSAEPQTSPPRPEGVASAAAVERIVARLAQRHGAGQAERIRRGVEQVAARWWPEDGGAEELAAFCEAQFVAGEDELAASFQRLERVMEQVDGHLHEVRRELLAPIDVERGAAAPATVVDRLLVHLDLGPHVDEDLFRCRVAFFALLNFPVHTLRERLAESAGWDRAAWARSRMMDRFASRVPAAVAQAVTRAATTAEEYVGAYNIRADRLIGPRGERLFAEGLRLISHWGLRDEIAAAYADRDRSAGLARQRLLLRVMERIVRQEIPAAVVDNPDLLWEPESNQVRPLAAASPAAAGLGAREPDRRYAHLLAIFRAHRELDRYTPLAPSLPARRFEVERQIPEDEVEALLTSILEAPEIDRLASAIERRLGRPLEPFDVWYSGFKARGGRGEAELDARVRALFPAVDGFQAALPDLLRRLGFSPERAAWLAGRIVVDRARGAGHALGAVRREDRTHLRTRIGDGGMDYKGWNVALHELGHNVEQVFSLAGIDHWWLAGVPNNACTEAFAFLFQERDLEVLASLEAPTPPSPPAAPAAGGAATGTATGTAAETPAEGSADRTLATLWSTFEIAGVSLVDMRVWRWLYAHPEATPAALREAVLGIAREVWNRCFAPRLGHPDREILAIYSHMIAYSLYLPDYPLGHVIAFQLAERLIGGGALDGAELERIARQGRLTPDAWMRGAVGGPLSAGALLAAARRALAMPEAAAPPGGDQR